jgi:hypothetical protein
VLPTARPGSPAAALEAILLTAPRPSAALAGMLFVRWAEESCGGRLSRAERGKMESVQAHLLAWGVLRDRIADGDTGVRDHEADLLPLFSAVHERLARLFAPRSRFWTQYRRLVRQQAIADRWERTPPTSVRFGPELIRRLGRKTALGRWPAAAVAERLGRAEMARRIDRDLDEILAALQLFDDVADAEEDAKAGQINAVLSAAPPEKSGLELHARIVRGIPPVCAAARTRLRRLSLRGGGLGQFARWVLKGHEEAERSAIEAARGRGVAAILERILASQQKKR